MRSSISRCSSSSSGDGGGGEDRLEQDAPQDGRGDARREGQEDGQGADRVGGDEQGDEAEAELFHRGIIAFLREGPGFADGEENWL